MADVSLSALISGSGIFPVLKADPTYAQSPNYSGGSSSYANFVSGFDNDGDYMKLPITNTSAVVYYNSAGTQITSGVWGGSGLEHSDIHANVTVWTGFMLDDTDSLLYIMGVDAAVDPDTYYLASVNAAGTLVNIGNAKAIFPTEAIWASPATGATIYRTSDGNGDIYLRTSGGAGSSVMEAKFSISNGSLISDGAATQPGGGVYKTAAGNTAGFFGLTNVSDALGDSTVLAVSGTNGATLAVIPLNAGWPATVNGLAPLQWGGRIVFAGLFNKVYGIRACTVADFEDRIDRIASVLGV